MKTENKPYPHFCANCARQIGENDREFWFDAFNPNPKPKTFCSVECIADYYGISKNYANILLARLHYHNVEIDEEIKEDSI